MTKSLEEVKEAVQALSDLRRKGTISVDEHARQVVVLAYDCVLDGQLRMAHRLLQGVPAEYFRTELHDHMRQDEVFADRAMAVAIALKDAGFLQEADSAITMGGGVA